MSALGGMQTHTIKLPRTGQVAPDSLSRITDRTGTLPVLESAEKWSFRNETNGFRARGHAL